MIRDITDKMGAGMAEYVSADLAQGTADQAAYDRQGPCDELLLWQSFGGYCHMVAGLVGEGLTGLFVASGMENVALAGQGHRGVGPLVALRGELVWPFCARFSVRRGVHEM